MKPGTRLLLQGSLYLMGLVTTSMALGVVIGAALAR